MRHLLIVESAGKIKKLKSILGSDWDVKASVGHIRQLASDGRVIRIRVKQCHEPLKLLP